MRTEHYYCPLDWKIHNTNCILITAYFILNTAHCTLYATHCTVYSPLPFALTRSYSVWPAFCPGYTISPSSLQSSLFNNIASQNFTALQLILLFLTHFTDPCPLLTAVLAAWWNLELVSRPCVARGCSTNTGILSVFDEYNFQAQIRMQIYSGETNLANTNTNIFGLTFFWQIRIYSDPIS